LKILAQKNLQFAINATISQKSPKQNPNKELQGISLQIFLKKINAQRFECPQK